MFQGDNVSNYHSLCSRKLKQSLNLNHSIAKSLNEDNAALAPVKQITN